MTASKVDHSGQDTALTFSPLFWGEVSIEYYIGWKRFLVMSSDVKAFSEGVQEDTVLENLGYQQELKRSFGLLGMIGFSFSIVTSWTALGGVLIVGVESGGPPVMIYSWIGISIFALAVAYSMAEMCSAYPLAGGQYSWVAVLAPPKIARGMSWLTGWFMITGILAMGATNNFIGANFIRRIFPTYFLFVQADREHRDNVSVLPCSPQKDNADLEKYNSGPSQPFVPQLHHRTLAHSSPRLPHRLVKHWR